MRKHWICTGIAILGTVLGSAACRAQAAANSVSLSVPANVPGVASVSPNFAVPNMPTSMGGGGSRSARVVVPRNSAVQRATTAAAGREQRTLAGDISSTTALLASERMTVGSAAGGLSARATSTMIGEEMKPTSFEVPRTAMSTTVSTPGRSSMATNMPMASPTAMPVGGGIGSTRTSSTFRGVSATSSAPAWGASGMTSSRAGLMSEAKGMLGSRGMSGGGLGMGSGLGGSSSASSALAKLGLTPSSAMQSLRMGGLSGNAQLRELMQELKHSGRMPAGGMQSLKSAMKSRQYQVR